MFAKHVSSLTSAYCHDELSPAESRRVAEHLIGCPRCRGEFEEIKFGARLAAQLPLLMYLQLAMLLQLLENQKEKDLQEE